MKSVYSIRSCCTYFGGMYFDDAMKFANGTKSFDEFFSCGIEQQKARSAQPQLKRSFFP